MRTVADPDREQGEPADPLHAAAGQSSLLSTNGKVARVDALDAILAALCRSVEAQSRDVKCAIFLPNDGGERRRRAVAPSLPKFAALDDVDFGPGLWHGRTGAPEERIVVVDDIAADPQWVDWREAAASQGVRSCWLAPICDPAPGPPLGVFAIFHRALTKLDADGADLMRRSAELARFIIRQERRAAEWRDAETRYRTLVEQLPAIIYVEQLTGDVDLYLSPQVEAVLGYAATDLMAGNPGWMDLVHPDDRSWVEAAVRRSDATGRYDEIYRMVARDGSVAWIRNQAVLVADDRGQPRYWHGVVSDLTERKRADERLAYLAHHDALTGLPNRARFMARLTTAMRRTAEGARPIAVLFIDLDGFKILNDSLGHGAGDRVLIEAAARLGAALGPDDTLARFGGDEFVVLVDDVASAADADRLADRLVAALRAPWSIDGCAAQVSASIGVTVFTGDRSVDPEDLLREADIALYDAKTAGRATRVRFSPTPSAPAIARTPSPNDPRQAMPERETVVRYQPQVDLATGRIVRLDASAYWDRLDGGLFPPAPFVRAQGATADVAPTGWWVVREACRQVRMWRVIAGDGSPGVSVLLSIHEFCRATLADELAAALAAADIEPAALEVRIAESTAAIADREIVAQVRALGAVVAVADFGKRDVSLARLQRLEVDALFLDASIAAGLGRDRGGMLAARIAATVGHDLGLTIGANGVAMAQQADALRRIGVERGQGDAFGARLCPQTVATLLTGGATLVTRGVGAVSGPAPGR